MLLFKARHLVIKVNQMRNDSGEDGQEDGNHDIYFPRIAERIGHDGQIRGGYGIQTGRRGAEKAKQKKIPYPVHVYHCCCALQSLRMRMRRVSIHTPVSVHPATAG